MRATLDRLGEALDTVPDGRGGALLLAEVLIHCDKAGKKLDKLAGKLRVSAAKEEKKAAG